MEEHQSKDFSGYIVSRITATWTVCFLLAQGISLVVGEALINTRWSTPNVDSWTFLVFGLAIAIPISGLFTALILRKGFPQIKLHHVILITFGWGVAAMMVWFVLSSWMTSD